MAPAARLASNAMRETAAKLNRLQGASLDLPRLGCYVAKSRLDARALYD